MCMSSQRSFERASMVSCFLRIIRPFTVAKVKRSPVVRMSDTYGWCRTTPPYATASRSRMASRQRNHECTWARTRMSSTTETNTEAKWRHDAFHCPDGRTASRIVICKTNVKQTHPYKEGSGLIWNEIPLLCCGIRYLNRYKCSVRTFDLCSYLCSHLFRIDESFCMIV